MPVEWSDESSYKREMNRWDRKKNQYITKENGVKEYGQNAVGFEKYPQMLYKAQKHPLSNTFQVAMDRDIISADKTVVLLSAEAFNASCQLVVHDDSEYERARADGWRDNHKEALEYVDGTEQAKAVEAAVRNFTDRNMSEKAKAEAAEYESKTAEHVPVIPEKPGLSPEAKQKLRDNLAKARAAKAAKKTQP